MQGTYALELFADGVMVYQTSAAVPADGKFGVYDGNYNPANWPNEGFSDADEWTLHVTVSPAGRSTSAGATVKKKFRKPYNSRSGLTVQQYNAFTISYLIQEEIDDLMLNYFLAGLQVTPQKALDGSLLDWSIDRTRVPRVENYQSWNDFRYDIRHGLFSDLHYFGHGAEDHLGGGPKNTQLEMWVLDRSRYLATNHMRYVALDGCNTAQKTTFLSGWIGHDSKVSRNKMRDKGWIPRFGWGWTDKKGVAYTYQGELLWAHFNFVTDYYTRLTHRDLSGYLDFTYEQAIDFGKHPNHQGVDPNVVNNSQGNSINYVGCYDCYFDE